MGIKFNRCLHPVAALGIDHLAGKGGLHFRLELDVHHIGVIGRQGEIEGSVLVGKGADVEGEILHRGEHQVIALGIGIDSAAQFHHFDIRRVDWIAGDRILHQSAYSKIAVGKGADPGRPLVDALGIFGNRPHRIGEGRIQGNAHIIAPAVAGTAEGHHVIAAAGLHQIRRRNTRGVARLATGKSGPGVLAGTGSGEGQDHIVVCIRHDGGIEIVRTVFPESHIFIDAIRIHIDFQVASEGIEKSGAAGHGGGDPDLPIAIDRITVGAPPAVDARTAPAQLQGVGRRVGPEGGNIGCGNARAAAQRIADGPQGHEGAVVVGRIDNNISLVVGGIQMSGGDRRSVNQHAGIIRVAEIPEIGVIHRSAGRIIQFGLRNDSHLAVIEAAPEAELPPAEVDRLVVVADFLIVAPVARRGAPVEVGREGIVHPGAHRVRIVGDGDQPVAGLVIVVLQVPALDPAFGKVVVHYNRVEQPVVRRDIGEPLICRTGEKEVALLVINGEFGVDHGDDVVRPHRQDRVGRNGTAHVRPFEAGQQYRRLGNALTGQHFIAAGRTCRRGAVQRVIGQRRIEFVPERVMDQLLID